MKGHTKYLGILEALQLNLVGTGSSCLACWLSSAGSLLCNCFLGGGGEGLRWKRGNLVSIGLPGAGDQID